MKIKRIVAYIIDFFIVSIISSLIFCLPFFNKYNNEYQEITSEYLKLIANSGSEEIDYDIESQLLYDMSKSSQPLSIINCGTIILYFGILSFILNGQTLGKKIMKIKVAPLEGNKLNPNLYMIREIIVTNLIPKILSIIALAFLNKSNWLIAQNIIGYLSNITLFLIIGFMIFRDDERGLHDIICKTNVIEVK